MVGVMQGSNKGQDGDRGKMGLRAGLLCGMMKQESIFNAIPLEKQSAKKLSIGCLQMKGLQERFKFKG